MAELVAQIFGHTKDTAMRTDIFAHQKHALIGLHFFPQCFVQGLGIC
jgi:hypothetical protein